MTAKERILAVRLSEKLIDKQKYAQSIGISSTMYKVTDDNRKQEIKVIEKQIGGKQIYERYS